MKVRIWLGSALLALACGSASAAVSTFTSQASFEAQLDGSFTLVNLDAAPLNTFGSSYRVEDAAPALAFADLGIDFFGFNARVATGQDFQITLPGRDRLIFHGANNGGLVTVNFLSPVDGVGVFGNVGDGGLVRAFSAPDLGGSFLGQASFGNGGFGGLTSTLPILSAQFTCDFNSDLRCGLHDLQFGTFANAVPEPQTYALLVAGLGLLGFAARRRSAPAKGISQ